MPINFVPIFYRSNKCQTGFTLNFQGDLVLFPIFADGIPNIIHNIEKSF